jgi:hypothetical protein
MTLHVLSPLSPLREMKRTTARPSPSPRFFAGSLLGVWRIAKQIHVLEACICLHAQRDTNGP